MRDHELALSACQAGAGAASRAARRAMACFGLAIRIAQIIHPVIVTNAYCLHRLGIEILIECLWFITCDTRIKHKSTSTGFFPMD